MNEITKTEGGIAAVIQQVALNPEVNPESIRQLFEIQKEILSIESEKAYHSAMAELQADLPTVTQNAEIRHGGKLISKYATFESINEAIRPHLQKHGFSVSFRSTFPEGQLEVTDIISHKDGHHEQTTMRLPFDTSGAKNNVQAIGSSVSYGKRYVLCMLLNISTGDMKDDDGRMAGTDTITAEQVADLQSLLEEHNRDKAKFLKMAKVDSLEEISSGAYKTLVQRVINAPHTGGAK